ncbi:hypothetical protein VTI74DRAFT_2276 [Chaetomium olivicolor]
MWRELSRGSAGNRRTDTVRGQGRLAEHCWRWDQRGKDGTLGPGRLCVGAAERAQRRAGSANRSSIRPCSRCSTKTGALQLGQQGHERLEGATGDGASAHSPHCKSAPQLISTFPSEHSSGGNRASSIVVMTACRQASRPQMEGCALWACIPNSRSKHPASSCHCAIWREAALTETQPDPAQR